MDISQIRRIRSGLALMVALLVLLPVVLVGLLAGPAQAADDPGSGRVVRVGTEGTYPPFTYMDPKTSQLTGYDIEVAQGGREARPAGDCSSCSPSSTRSSPPSTASAST